MATSGNGSHVTCHYCRMPGELRPYGPNGAWLCFHCMIASPEREAAAKAVFGAQLDAAGPVAVATRDGPVPQPLTTPASRPLKDLMMFCCFEDCDQAPECGPYCRAHYEQERGWSEKAGGER